MNVKKVAKVSAISIISLIVLVVILMLSVGIKPISFGMHDEVYSVNKLALNGYDPVSFFVNEKPIKGNDTIQFVWKDVSWKFASSENKVLFQSNPEKYAPQYGGHCAFAVDAGFAVEGNPEYYLIKDEKLYILSNQDVLDDFKKAGDEIIKSCNANWK